MNSVSYIPSKDELNAVFRPTKKKATKKFGHFRFRVDDDGSICAVQIDFYRKELEEFKSKLGTIRLGGIWKGIKISRKDIKETREELLKHLDSRW